MLLCVHFGISKQALQCQSKKHAWSACDYPPDASNAFHTSRLATANNQSLGGILVHGTACVDESTAVVGVIPSFVTPLSTWTVGASHESSFLHVFVFSLHYCTFCVLIAPHQNVVSPFPCRWSWSLLTTIASIGVVSSHLYSAAMPKQL